MNTWRDRISTFKPALLLLNAFGCRIDVRLHFDDRKERRAATIRRSQVKALVLNALGRGFDFEDVDIAIPVGREYGRYGMEAFLETRAILES